MNKYWKIVIPTGLIALIAIGFIYFRQSARTQTLYVNSTGDKSLADYYQEAQQLSSENSNSTTTATFLAVGDIMLSRDVAAAVNKTGDVDFPFEKISDLLKSTNFNFANLEGPVAPAAANERIGGSSMIFGDPPENLRGLKDYNFQIINLANNHAWDQGLSGIDATTHILDNLQIAHEGAADNLDQAWTPAVVESNGIKICFLGAAYGTNSGGSQAAQYVAEISETDKLKSAIVMAKSECDFTVVTMHAGIEYTRTPDSQQISFAHAAIDDGADMVIGAHPHWVQPIERYCPGSSATILPSPSRGEGGPPTGGTGEGTANCSSPKYIFYSLGNFVFDQDFSQDTMEGLALKITISKVGTGRDPSLHAATADDLQGTRQPATLQSITLVPVIISNSQPRPATADESKKILNKIGQARDIINP